MGLQPWEAGTASDYAPVDGFCSGALSRNSAERRDITTPTLTGTALDGEGFQSPNFLVVAPSFLPNCEKNG